MSDNKDKTQVEQFRVSGRNNDIVVRQLVEKYNASEGWAVVRVSSSPLSLDVYLERNVSQGKPEKSVVNKDVTQKEILAKDVVANQEEVFDEKDKPTSPKKTTASKTATKK